jgi:hypothetical protein
MVVLLEFAVTPVVLVDSMSSVDDVDRCVQWFNPIDCAELALTGQSHDSRRPRIYDLSRLHRLRLGLGLSGGVR